jgi:hypothetical protein
MAPEQLTGTLVDARTDLFALGCILYEMLVGEPPGRPRSGPSRASMRPSDRVRGVPAGLDALVEGLLCERPRDRIGHAEDVRSWVASMREATPHETVPPAVRIEWQRPWLYRPFLSGRSDAVTRLARDLGQARRGRGVFVVIEGDSGIGKTHLASEIARRAADDCTVVPVASEPEGGEAPLASWSRFFEAVVDRALVEPGSSAARIVSDQLPLLRGLHAAFARVDLSPAPTSAPPPPTREEVAALMREMIGAMCEERPLVLLLDDLQWADELTVAVLERMTSAWLSERGVLLLATCRTHELRPRLASILDSPGLTRVALGPLPEASLRDLVADMLGVGEPPEAIVGWIARRADGNPFVAAEYLRLVVSELPIQREVALPTVRIFPPERGRLDALPTPRSVRELVSRRVDALDAPCRFVLDLLAVLGGAVDADAYASLGESMAERDALLELDRRQLIEPGDDGGRRMLHDWVRVVVYEQLTEARRSALHREAALLLQRTAAAAGAEPPHAALGRHFRSAGMALEALPHLERAGEVALLRAAYGAAAVHFENALATSEELAAGGTVFPAARRARWALGAARAAFGSSDLAGCEMRVREALSLVERRLPRSRVAWALLAMREAAQGAAGGLVAAAGPARGSAELLAAVAQATGLLPYRYFYEEDLLPLVASALLAANLARQADPAEIIPAPYSLLAAILGLFRLSGVASSFFDRAQRAAAAAGDWREATLAHALESVYQGSFGRWQAAEVSAARAAAACEGSRDPWLRENVETTLSHVAFFTGRFEEARRRAEFLAQSAIERQNIQHEIWGLFLQARSDIPCARYAAARTLLEGALSRLQSSPEPISEIACNGMLAHVMMIQGEMNRAQSLAAHVNEQVRARLPSAYPSLVGYAAAAAVHRALIESAPSSERWAAARQMEVALWRFAAVFPVAMPAAHLHSAHLLRLAGWKRAAHALFLRGASRAEAWGMPRERGLLLLGAARTAPGAAQPALRRDAERILESIGCTAEMF